MRRKKLWITGLSVFLVLALIAGGVAVFVQRGSGKGCQSYTRFYAYEYGYG